MDAENADRLSVRGAALPRSGLDEHMDVFGCLLTLAPTIQEAAGLVAATLSGGGKLMLCGNGGSAADSQPIAAELTGRFLEDRPPIAAVALSTDTSALTRIANDHGFDVPGLPAAIWLQRHLVDADQPRRCRFTLAAAAA